jgi:CheY-like chemotaxis protein
VLTVFVAHSRELNEAELAGPDRPTTSRFARVARSGAAQTQLDRSVELQRDPYSLLITDDDLPFRESLRDVFETEGFRTFLAGSGEEAIDIVQERHVHVALLDQHMPRLTGLETLRILRQMNALLPVILLTADSTQQLLHDALSAQAFCVMSKPVSPNMVVHTVLRAIKRYYDAFRGDLGRRQV